MIVTCESCKSRYKLDDSKITGRGAKITCPKCRHVFVVLAGGPAAARPAPGGPHWEEDEPTRVDEAVQVPKPKLEVAREPVKPPPPEPPAAPNPPVMPVHEVVRPSSAAAAAPKVDHAALALTLDFRKVGVTAWKAKIKIGLVYDFSDIKTLRRYIQDGRVTPSDVISYDGKNWRTIGDIPDLDAFFVETYQQLEKEQAKAPPPAGPAPADLDTVAAAVAAGEPSTGPMPTIQDPVRPKPKKPPTLPPQKARAVVVNEPRSSGTAGWLVVAAGVLILAGVGAWYGMQDPGGGGAVAQPRPAATASAPARAPEPVRRTPEEVRSALEEKGTPVAPEPPVAEPVAEAAPVEAAPAEGAEDRPKPNVENPLGDTRGLIPVVPSQATQKAVSQAAAGASSGAVPRSSSAADHEAIGDQERASGNWGAAAQAYGKAAALSRDPGLLYKLGEAQFRSGNLDGAAATLERVKNSLPAARSLLADVYDQLGDPAKANALRQASGTR